MSRKTIAAFGVFILLVVVGLAIAFNQQLEPTYDSKPVSYWALRLANRRDQTAGKAIENIGSNALPALTQLLGSKDWPHRAEVVSWVASQKFLSNIVRFSPSAETKQSGALIALDCLRTNARPALPTVLPLLTNKSLKVKIRAVFVITATAPDAESVRTFVPVLTNDLTAPDWTMRLAALRALNAIRPSPPEANAALLALLKDPDENVRDGELDCLVVRTNSMAISVLDAQLHGADTFLVTKAAARLAVFGDEAKASVPRLEALCDNPTLSVRQAATNALIAITGKTVASRGPKPGADITFNFPGIPIEVLIDTYESWAKKKVLPPKAGWPNGLVRAVTPYSLTTSEALQLIEDVLKQQANVVIHRLGDGSLSAEVLDVSQGNTGLDANNAPQPARRLAFPPRRATATKPSVSPSPQ